MDKTIIECEMLKARCVIAGYEAENMKRVQNGQEPLYLQDDFKKIQDTIDAFIMQLNRGWNK